MVIPEQVERGMVGEERDLARKGVPEFFCLHRRAFERDDDIAERDGGDGAVYRLARLKLRE